MNFDVELNPNFGVKNTDRRKQVYQRLLALFMEDMKNRMRIAIWNGHEVEHDTIMNEVFLFLNSLWLSTVNFSRVA